MTSRVASITFDCGHAADLAAFWAEVLGRSVDEGQPDQGEFFASIGRDETGSGPMMMFIKVPEGKDAKNRVHLDLDTDEREAEVERLVALGATRVHDKDEWGVRWTTLTDPEGNEFCVATHP